MIPTRKSRRGGFTMIELVMVILIMVVIAGMTASYWRSGTDSERWEETRFRMEALRAAIMGDRRVNTGAERNRFGYFGDMGRLPTALSALTTPETPAYVYSTYYGVGAGWRGPYFNGKFSGSYGADRDAWGNAFVYTTTSNPPQLVSFGADGVAGGAVFSSDLTVLFPVTDRLSTVRGSITDSRRVLSTQVVELMYPVAGTLTAFLTTTDSQGAFLYAGVPFGQRSISVTSLTPRVGPIPLIVDQSQVYVSPNIGDRFGASAIQYNSGSAVVGTVSISVNTVILVSAVSSGSTITLGYTIPTNKGNNLALVVGASAEDETLSELPSNANFGGVAMTLITADYTGFSFNSFSAGFGMFSLVVTAGQKGTIRVNYQGTNDLRAVGAATLAEVTGSDPEAVVTAKNQNGEISTTITTQTDGAMVVSYGHTGNQGTWTATGTGHTVDKQQNISGGGSSSVLGHLLVNTAGVQAGVGFTHTNENRMGVVLAAFRPFGRAVSITMTNTYDTSQVLRYITVRWNDNSVLNRVSIGGVFQDVGRVTSGTRIQINPVMTVPAGSTTTDLELIFNNTMGARDFVVIMEWASGERDTLRFSTP